MSFIYISTSKLPTNSSASETVIHLLVVNFFPTLLIVAETRSCHWSEVAKKLPHFKKLDELVEEFHPYSEQAKRAKNCVAGNTRR